MYVGRDVELVRPVAVEIREQCSVLKPTRVPIDALDSPLRFRIFARAEEKGVKTLAFPPIGTGLYQVPMDLCARVMVDTISAHLANGATVEEVFIVAPDPREINPFKAKIEEGA